MVLLRLASRLMTDHGWLAALMLVENVISNRFEEKSEGTLHQEADKVTSDSKINMHRESTKVM